MKNHKISNRKKRYKQNMNLSTIVFFKMRSHIWRENWDYTVNKNSAEISKNLAELISSGVEIGCSVWILPAFCLIFANKLMKLAEFAWDLMKFC